MKHNLKKIAWYSVENLTALVFGLISVVLIARLFGPENFGKLSYIQTLSALTIFITTLGVDHVVVRDLARKPNNAVYISTVFITQFFTWLLQSFVVFSLLILLSDEAVESDVLVLYFLISIFSYFNRATVVGLYFQAINEPRKIAVSALCSRVVALIYLVIAILFELPYEYVVVFIPLQALIQFLVLLYYFSKKIKITFHYNIHLMKKVLMEALPLMLAGALYPIFMQADIVLIKYLMSDYDAGIYSAASKVVMQFTFIGTIVTMAFYLPLSQRVDNKSDDAKVIISGLIKVLFVAGLLISISVSLFSDIIIYLLYGKEFQEASGVLSVVVWKTIFIFIAALLTRLLILTGLARFELLKSLIAATFSLTLNFFLIPLFGLLGASIVSVLSYLLADFLIFYFIKPTRSIFTISLSSIIEIFIRPFKTISDIRYLLEVKAK